MSFLLSLFRHGLTSGAAWLVAKGVIPAAKESEAVEIGAMLLTALAGAVMSAWQKHRAAGQSPAPLKDVDDPLGGVEETKN